MAEVDTQMLSSQHSDIRREVASGVDKTGDLIAATSSDIRLEQQKQAFDLSRQSGAETNEVVKEGLKSAFETRGDIKDTRYDVASRVEDAADRVRGDINNGMASLTSQFFTVARDTADLRAQVIQAIDTTKMATELNGLKSIIEGQRNTTYLSDKISADGEKTRELINELKYHDLSRGLIERNSELVEERNWGRHWYHGANQAQFGQQFAQLQSQMQNFNSQLAETRQGMVNFGTMAGNAGQQTSSTNNVR